MQTLTVQELYGNNWGDELKGNFRMLAEGDICLKLEDGTIMKSAGRLTGRKLEKGQKVAALYDTYNCGLDIMEICGVTGNEEKYGKGGVKYDSVKEALKETGCKSLKELEQHTGPEYGMDHYLVLRDLEPDEGGGDYEEGEYREGPWGYLFKGRWGRGSGPDIWSWVLLEEIDAEKERAEKRDLEIAAASLRKQQQFYKDKAQALKDQLCELNRQAHLAAIEAQRLERKVNRIDELLGE